MTEGQTIAYADYSAPRYAEMFGSYGFNGWRVLKLYSTPALKDAVASARAAFVDPTMHPDRSALLKRFADECQWFVYSREQCGE